MSDVSWEEIAKEWEQNSNEWKKLSIKLGKKLNIVSIICVIQTFITVATIAIGFAK